MNVQEIGWVETCYDEKFGTPRQSGVVGAAWGKISFHVDYQSADFIRGLEGFSHLWLLWVFHESALQSSGVVKATVRPPRLGGNEKVGVFASRSPFRPNPIGLSLVRLERVEVTATGGNIVHVSGVDLVSGTPLLDIKPYIPYCDSVSVDEVDAGGKDFLRSGYVDGAPESLAVEWCEGVVVNEEMRKLITETVAVDPRPAYHDDEREYGCLIAGVNVRWQVVSGNSGRVVKILSCTGS
ncbi:MAG: tRNA (N6-threonylcarbamoyladenosine(37)-N6)-methyltransferase TrmO [Akkermansiaceae bacterium]